MSAPASMTVAEAAHARFLYLAMARQLLEADVLVAGLGLATQRRAARLSADGWRLALEIFAEADGLVTVSLAAIRDGRHQLLGSIREHPGSAQ